MVRSFLFLSVLFANAALAAAAPSGAAGDVNIYSWSSYIDDSAIPRFQEETKLKVTYDVYDSNEMLEGKLLAGNTGYDIVVPTSNFIAKQIQAGAYQPIDRSKLPNLANLDPALMKELNKYDPGNRFAVPYLWGTNGIGYNEAMVKAALGEDAPVDSLALILDPKYASKLEKCGIAMLDSSTEIFPLVLNYMGIDPGSEKSVDYIKAMNVLAEIKQYTRYFNSSKYLSDLANGEICVVIGYSGDILQAAATAQEAGNGHKIKFSIPKEGSTIWVDSMMIPADAPNPEAAHAWMNYMLRPEVIAKITDYVTYANPNIKATKLVDKGVSSDPGIYPPAEVKSRLWLADPLTPKAQRASSRAWTMLKTRV